jgi:predicted DNA-binding transcriptional regulator YafY
MLGLRALSESFADKLLSPPPIEAADTDNPALLKLKIAFSPCAAYKVYDEFDEGNIKKLEDGSMIVEANLPEDEWIYGFLLSLGPFARVLEPQRVRERLLEEIDSLKNFYSTF